MVEAVSRDVVDLLEEFVPIHTTTMARDGLLPILS